MNDAERVLVAVNKLVDEVQFLAATSNASSSSLRALLDVAEEIASVVPTCFCDGVSHDSAGVSPIS